MTHARFLPAAAIAAALLTPQPAPADPPAILAANAMRVGMGWRIDVTLEHPDTGWDHYADGWDVLDEAGNVLGVRELMHPHIEEQPFTRSLYNLMLPDGMKRILIRTRCSQDGWSSQTVAVDLNR